MPLVTGLFAFSASAALGALDFLGVYPFTYNAINIYGYVLTPFVVFLSLAWDSAAQRSGRRDPWFDVRPGYSRTLRILSVASLLVATFHIFELGRVLGEWAVQSGFAS